MMASESIQDIGPQEKPDTLGSGTAKQIGPVAWTIGLALATGVLGVFGASYQSGFDRALAIYSVGAPQFDKSQIAYGAKAVVTEMFLALLCCIAIIFILWVLRAVLSSSAPEIWRDLCRVAKTKYFAAILLCFAFCDVVAMEDRMAHLIDDSVGVVLKPYQELNGTTKDLFDEDNDNNFYQDFRFGFGDAFLILVVYWVLQEICRNRLGTILLVAWISLEGLDILGSHAYLSGVSGIAQPFPVVSFSSPSLSLVPESTAVLLCSDDKQFILLVLTKGQHLKTEKVILYLPKSEVKWLKTTSTARLKDLMK